MDIQIYYFPYESSANSYVSRNKEILREIGKVNKLPYPNHILDVVNMIRRRNKDVVLLNWYEDLACSKGVCKYIVYLIYLFFLYIIFKKIVWIRHNYKPHSNYNNYMYKFIISVLMIVSKSKVTHRPIKGYSYVPHINYKTKNIACKDLRDRDIDNLIFGNIKRYKGIVELLNEWPKNRNLYIVGKCEDSVLESQILDIIDRRNLSVTYDNRFISEEELNDMLSNSKIVILPHLDKCMIVSGTFYHAASFGANIAMVDGEFYNYVSSEYSFVFRIDMKESSYFPPNLIIDEILESTNDKIIVDSYKKLFFIN